MSSLTFSSLILSYFLIVLAFDLLSLWFLCDFNYFGKWVVRKMRKTQVDVSSYYSTLWVQFQLLCFFKRATRRLSHSRWQLRSNACESTRPLRVWASVSCGLPSIAISPTPASPVTEDTYVHIVYICKSTTSLIILWVALFLFCLISPLTFMFFVQEQSYRKPISVITSVAGAVFEWTLFARQRHAMYCTLHTPGKYVSD